MRITVEIDEKKLASILMWTRQPRKSPAISQALEEYLVQKERQAFLDRVMSGQTDYATTNDEVEILAHEAP